MAGDHDRRGERRPPARPAWSPGTPRTSSRTVRATRAGHDRPRCGQRQDDERDDAAATPRSRPAITASADRTGDGRASRVTIARTTWTTWPAARSHTTLRSPADVAGLLALPHAAVDVAEHAAGQRAVEELRAVVRRDRAASGIRRPSPRAISRQRQAETTRRHGGDGERPRQSGRVDPAQPVDERPGAQPQDQDGQDRRAAGQAHPPPQPLARPGRTSRHPLMSWVRAAGRCGSSTALEADASAGQLGSAPAQDVADGLRPAGQRRGAGCAAADRSSLAASASSSQRAMAAPSAGGSSGADQDARAAGRRLARPSASGTPPTSVAITGSPRASASVTTRP